MYSYGKYQINVYVAFMYYAQTLIMCAIVLMAHAWHVYFKIEILNSIKKSIQNIFFLDMRNIIFRHIFVCNMKATGVKQRCIMIPLEFNIDLDWLFEIRKKRHMVLR